MKAVLLAAGRGSRLGLAAISKPFVEIGRSDIYEATAVTLLGRQIALLQESGIEQIAVVVGYEQAKARAMLRHSSVTIVENTTADIATSGTAHSFQFAAYSPFNPLDGQTGCLLMDGDLIYQRAVLRTILKFDGGSALLVSSRSSGDAEEVRVYGAAGAPRLIGKKLASPAIDGLDLLGEATGIVRFDPAEHALVRRLLDALVGTPDTPPQLVSSGIACEHEELSQHLIDLGRLRAVGFDAELLFYEVDFQEDLEHVRRTTYPEILRREGP